MEATTGEGAGGTEAEAGAGAGAGAVFTATCGRGGGSSSSSSSPQARRRGGATALAGRGAAAAGAGAVCAGVSGVGAAEPPPALASAFKDIWHKLAAASDTSAGPFLSTSFSAALAAAAPATRGVNISRIASTAHGMEQCTVCRFLLLFLLLGPRRILPQQAD